MDVILKNLHPIHVELTSTSLEIAFNLCCKSDDGYHFVLKSLNKLYD